jgi:hypothetical protein
MPRLDQKTQVGAIATTDLIVCLRGGAFVLAAVGSMALQNAGSVNIDGGAIDGTPIGSTTPSTISGTTGDFTGPVEAPIFRSFAGSTASTANNTAVTIHNCSPSGMYMVYAFINAFAGPNAFNAHAVVTSAGVASSAKLTAVNANFMTITLSGMNIQVTQGSGVAQVIAYRIFRIA